LPGDGQLLGKSNAVEVENSPLQRWQALRPGVLQQQIMLLVG
jgi:hypothetical protein